MRLLLIPILVLAGGCAPADEPLRGGSEEGVQAVASEDGGAGERALRTTLERAHALADSIEDLLRPVPLMRPAQEEALRRYGQSAQLARARSLGIRPSDDAEIEALADEERLVLLEDSTRYWVLRDLRASRPLVTPDTRALLERLGARFQERLAQMGLPPYRLEITSALRSAADQASLRQRNVNAAQGTSTHEFGTTVDVAYSAFAPPEELPPDLLPEGPEWLRPYQEAIARSVLESVSARKSRELKAILGEVLSEAQSEGLVMVTLERLQPVYHMTVGRRMAGGEA